MAELVNLEINEHVAAQQAVIENQINEEMVLFEGKAFLAGFEEKAFAKFEQKVIEPVNNGSFQIGFGITRLFVQPQEFENIRFFEHVFGFDDNLPFVGQLPDGLLASAQCETFVQAGGKLAFEFRLGPTGLGGLDFVKTALIGVFNGKE